MFRGGLWLMMIAVAISASGPIYATAQADEDSLDIVTTSNILADVAANVAGEAGNVHALLPVGANPHAFELTARDIAAVADADVIFTVGMEFDRYLYDMVADAGTDAPIVVASRCVPILPFGIMEAATMGMGGVPAEVPRVADAESLPPCPEVSWPDGYDPDEDPLILGRLQEVDCDALAESGTGCDPHVWMDPRNVAFWALEMAEALSRLEPDRAGVYEANAESYVAELEELDSWIRAEVEIIPPENRLLVTNHMAYGYLAHAYGFSVAGVVIPGGDELSEPSAAELAALIDTVRELGIPAVFAETIISTNLADAVAAETGAEVYRLYSGSLSEPDGPAPTYIDMMRYNTETIVEGLSRWGRP